ncbi:MAG: PqqD family protein [Clostridiales bacterium]|nr:PqqD family protein [Clostridiales bacterium]
MKRYHRNLKVESAEMTDELGMLNIETGRYHVLDSVGKDVWNLIENPVTVESIVAELVKEYDVDELTCKNDVEVFIDLMLEKQLVLEV